MKVQKGKLYRMTSHKGLGRKWLEEHGEVWLATEDEWDRAFRESVDTRPDWVAGFKSVASGHLFRLTRYQPWSVTLEELDGGNP